MQDKTLQLVTDDFDPARFASAPTDVREWDPETVRELTRLVTEIRKATRPIIIRDPAPVALPYQAAPVPYQPTVTPIDVHIPPALATEHATPSEHLPRLFTRAEVFYFSGMTIIGTGTVGFVSDAFVRLSSWPLIPIGCFWVLLSAAAINRWAHRYGGIEVLHGRVKPRSPKR